MSGQFTNLEYDGCAYSQRLKQSTGPLNWELDLNRFVNCNNLAAFHGGQSYPYNAVQQVDLDSSLKGLDTLASNCSGDKQPFCQSQGCITTNDPRVTGLNYSPPDAYFWKHTNEPNQPGVISTNMNLPRNNGIQVNPYPNCGREGNYMRSQPMGNSQGGPQMMNPQMMNPQMMNPQMMNPQMMNPQMMHPQYQAQMQRRAMMNQLMNNLSPEQRAILERENVDNQQEMIGQLMGKNMIPRDPLLRERNMRVGRSRGDMMPGGRDMMSGGRDMMSGGRDMMPGGRDMMAGGRDMMSGGRDMMPSGRGGNMMYGGNTGDCDANYQGRFPMARDYIMGGPTGSTPYDSNDYRVNYPQPRADFAMGGGKW